jgi:YggT family protein
VSYLANALALLIQLAFGALATLFLLRVMAEACRADFHNPLSQFVYRYTNPVVAPLRRVLPNWRRVNLAAVLVTWLVLLIERALLFALSGLFPALPGLLLLAVADLLDFALVFYLVLVFAWSLMGLFQVDRYHPVLRLADALVAPLLRPLRGRLVAGGLDFGPWAVMIVLMLARILVVGPIAGVGMRLAMGMGG